MLTDDLLQDMFLVRTDVDQQDMFTGAQRVLEALEIVMGLLDTDKPPLPGAKTQNDDREKNWRYPGRSLV